MSHRVRIFWIVIITLLGAGILMVVAGLLSGARFGSLPLGVNVSRQGGIQILSVDELRADIGEVNWTAEQNNVFRNINALEIDAGIYEVILVQHESEDIIVDVSRTSEHLQRNIIMTQNGDSLRIHDTENSSWSWNIGGVRDWIIGNAQNVGISQRVIVVAIPYNHQFEEVVLELGIGRAVIEHVETQTLIIESGIGEVEVQSFVAGIVDVHAGIGKVSLAGTTLEEITLEGGIGEIIYHSSGQQDDYRISADTGIGRIRIGGLEIGMFSDDVRAWGSGQKEMSISGGIGEVNVMFGFTR